MKDFIEHGCDDDENALGPMECASGLLLLIIDCHQKKLQRMTTMLASYNVNIDRLVILMILFMFAPFCHQHILEDVSLSLYFDVIAGLLFNFRAIFAWTQVELIPRAA